MRILHLIDTFNFCDGCSRHVYILAREQARTGHEVLIILGGGDALTLLEEAGLRFLNLPLLGHGQRSTARFFLGALVLRKRLREFMPDIIHAHQFYAANLVRVGNHFSKVPLILTVHANLPAQGRLPHHPGDRIIAVSESTRRLILQRDPKKSGLLDVIFCGVEFLGFDDDVRSTDEFQLLQSKKTERCVVTFIGRFVEVKGVAVLLQAIAKMIPDIPITLALAGSGELEQDVLREAQLLGIDCIHFGLLRDVKPVLELTDVFVIPSLRMEGLPIVLQEAGLMRVATVASRTDGIPEIIEDGVNGLLVPPGDAAALREALRRLHSDPAYRAALGQSLHETIVHRFGIDRMTNSIEEVYRKALQKK